MFYVIEYENGVCRYGNFNNYNEALNYAESCNGGWNFTISEYENEEEYYKNI